ncbi:sigma-70 family RNA polymerase sigma factor [Clostridium botulinum]|uniref:sigma-70 family RNA polymerase sigma factor n=1 Tax=Clostridium botulinum TaxID=1491 RepID=UPI001749E4F5|nr:sigma-70 family RNA polymerase sigma factor [Clostridium botulinum]MBD5637575.1 sigma-70 family RNA polymerase sigma factor [Clostridium botulinum]
MLRNFKTSQKNRTNYIYYPLEGEAIKIVPNEDGVTDAIIATLHSFDDEEVDADRRENYHVPVHMNAYYDEKEDDAADRNAYLTDNDSNPLESIIKSIEETEHEEKIDKLRDAIETLKPQQKELIKKIFYEKRTNVSIAAEEGVSEAAIRKRLKKIYENLRKKI